jgi:uncharacterized tellurite resistance protein B-like protein
MITRSIKMNKFKAAFEILWLITLADGYADSGEINVIKSFLMDNYGSINFSLEETIQVIDMMDEDGKIEEFKTAVIAFKNASSATDRINLLDFALEIVTADEKLTDEEGLYFNYLASAWNVNLDKFLRNKLRN